MAAEVFTDATVAEYQFSLENGMIQQAIMYAELLFAETRGADLALYMLGKAYYMNGEVMRAYSIMRSLAPKRDMISPAYRIHAIYLLAKCCYDTGKYSDCAELLYASPRRTSGRSSASGPLMIHDPSHVINGAAGCHLMGQCFERMQERQSAIECYRKALFLRPSMLSSSERLAALTAGELKPVVSLVTNPLKFDSLISVLNSIFQFSYSFDYPSTVKLVDSLPASVRDTPFIRGLLGKLLMDVGMYEESILEFLKIKNEILKISFSEIISINLANLKKLDELIKLNNNSIKLIELNSNYKIWISIGNLFSIKGEHESAIKYFNRSIQINPNNPAAHCLIGHEFLTQGKLDKATAAYTSALDLDGRHWQALYGLGMVSSKQEDWGAARVHLAKSVAINPNNFILRNSFSTILLNLNEIENCYNNLNSAITLNQKNLPGIVQRAILDFSVHNRVEQARGQLEFALTLPGGAEEPMVNLVLGKIYKSQGRREDSVRLFNKTIDIVKNEKNSNLKLLIEEIDSN
jgi:tetratricopeptide (TPR) repeat protein